MRNSGNVDEALVVRIYRRLQTLEFDPDIFRTKPLIFLSRPSTNWRQSQSVFWSDAGDIFDQYFGYAKLTYEHEDLHRFFTQKLGVCEEVPLEKLAKNLCLRAWIGGVSSVLRWLMRFIASANHGIAATNRWKSCHPPLRCFCCRAP